ncbi:MAG: NTP transferase domain-containing protein [Candidatus Magasanikbacteria bacterium]|nr:NTP transferase domain-containing protein [Candidatus Magasanikbacteria bacterium]
MKTIIIGAGRGRRLEHLTAQEPKPFTVIQGKRILDWVLAAHRANGITDLTYIGGYLLDVVKQNYPALQFRHNTEWASNNILQSLWYAADDMDNGFISTYADILYQPGIVAKLLASPADITIAVDTDWRTRYRHRSLHPTTDAEKVTVAGGRIARLHRAIPDNEAAGEFIGVAKFSPRGAQIFKTYHQALPPNFQFEGKIPLARAYLIHFLNYLVEQGVEIKFVTTPGYYIEVDTLEDYAYAETYWQLPNPQLIASTV